MTTTPDVRWTQPTFEKRYGAMHDLEPHNVGHYAVQEPVMVWVLTGKTRASNHWIGAANVLSCELRRVLCQPGDEIHALYGGLWLLRAGEQEACQIATDEYASYRASVQQLRPGQQRKCRYVRK